MSQCLLNLSQVHTPLLCHSLLDTHMTSLTSLALVKHVNCWKCQRAACVAGAVCARVNESLAEGKHKQVHMGSQ